MQGGTWVGDFSPNRGVEEYGQWREDGARIPTVRPNFRTGEFPGFDFSFQGGTTKLGSVASSSEDHKIFVLDS